MTNQKWFAVNPREHWNSDMETTDMLRESSVSQRWKMFGVYIDGEDSEHHPTQPQLSMSVWKPNPNAVAS